MRRRILLRSLSALCLCATRGFVCAAQLPSARLQRLLALVPESSVTVADIGCDHGLLARALARTRFPRNVFAVDRSEAALAAAKLAVGGVSSLPEFLLGDGLRPLVPCAASVETVVCAGMGSSTTAQILRDGDLLQQLGVQRLVLQPWPSYLLPLSSLLHTAQQLGFARFEQQYLDSENGIHYITTSLVRDGQAQVSSEVDFFMRGPLFSSPSLAADPDLFAYLREQQRDLGLRKRARSLSHSDRGDVIPAFDLAITRFLKEHM